MDGLVLPFFGLPLYQTAPRQKRRTTQTNKRTNKSQNKTNKSVSSHKSGIKHIKPHKSKKAIEPHKLINRAEQKIKQNIFLRNLANLLATKSGEDYASVITWIRTILIFNILRTIHLCIRGSRTPFRNKNILDDFRLNNHEANIL